MYTPLPYAESFHPLSLLFQKQKSAMKLQPSTRIAKDNER